MDDSIARDGMKRAAAERAVREVQNGMVLGLGTGTTAAFMLVALARRIGEGLRVTGIPTSEMTAAAAQRLGIPLKPMTAGRRIDLTIDGADQIERATLNLIKGGGGALLREKIAAQASHRVIIVADDSKLSDRLGTRQALPVEVLPFGWRSQARFLAALGARVSVRRMPDGQDARTDQDNMILDCAFGAIADAAGLADLLSGRAGIVGHGLFLDLADDVIVAGPDGIRHMRRADASA
jgi:ribose 5-phosphate isomerase A